MIKSMTGYGRGEISENGFHVCVEIKTLNHRFLDVSLRLPKPLSALEEKLRLRIADSIKRGRVEINVSLETYGKSLDVLELNSDLLNQYLAILNTIKDKFALSGDIKVSDILSLSGVIEIKNVDIDVDNLWVTLDKALSIGIKI